MCLIIDNSNGVKVDHNLIDTAEWLNSHGFGIIYLDDMTITKGRSVSPVELCATDRPFVAHFRYATVGSISDANCHPFEVVSGGKLIGYLMSNGTVKTHGDKKITDTHSIAKMLGNIPGKYWSAILGMTETRFLFVGMDGRVRRYGTWIEHQGVLLSKGEVLEYLIDDDSIDGSREGQDNHFHDYDIPNYEYVAVYGTLKYGKGNAHYLEDSEFIDNAKTVDPYKMIVDGLPYVYHDSGKGAKNIKVEVYYVNNEELDALDSLEGHPTHYQRKKIKVKLSCGTVITAWLYFINATFNLNHQSKLVDRY